MPPTGHPKNLAHVSLLTVLLAMEDARVPHAVTFVARRFLGKASEEKGNFLKFVIDFIKGRQFFWGPGLARKASGDPLAQEYLLPILCEQGAGEDSGCREEQALFFNNWKQRQQGKAQTWLSI